MPASRSRPARAEAARAASAPDASAFAVTPRAWFALALLALLAVALVALPAGLAAYALPAGLQASDFSGTIWHGAAEHVRLRGRELGAVEWQLHPAALFTLELAADVRWVTRGFVLDGRLAANPHGLHALDVTGGGPIEDLGVLGAPAGWRGQASVHLSRLDLVRVDGTWRLGALAADARIEDLAGAALAGGASLGNYTLHAPATSADAAGTVTARIRDGGGPLDLDAVLTYSTREARGVLSGTVRERGNVPAALHARIEELASVRPRDSSGRIPIDLELSL